MSYLYNDFLSRTLEDKLLDIVFAKKFKPKALFGLAEFIEGGNTPEMFKAILHECVNIKHKPTPDYCQGIQDELNLWTGEELILRVIRTLSDPMRCQSYLGKKWDMEISSATTNNIEAGDSVAIMCMCFADLL